MQRKWALFIVVLLTMIFPYSGEAKDLDINQYRETFSETFRNTLDVTSGGPSRWIAHTPWHGDFGDAQFVDPVSNFPFVTGPDGLKIIAQKNLLNGKWQSGLLSSVDSKDRGFSQSNGYFEVRMKLPPGPGVWPSFWLHSNGNSEYGSEIDVIEYYGQFPDSYRVTNHLWPHQSSLKHENQSQVIKVPPGSLVDSFHTYGVEITGTDVVFYLDRHEVARMPATPAAHEPMSILVNLALGSGWPIDKTINPSVLQVDYINAYERK